MKYVIFLIVLFTLIICMCIIFYKPSYDDKFNIIIKNPNYHPTKLLIVAHPDDEILWGFNYLIKDPLKWKVICLTNSQNKERVREFMNAMNKINIKNYEIWNHDDNIFAIYMDKKCVNDIKNDIDKNKYKLILTHNHFGEYGNLQHICVNRILTHLKNKYNYPVHYFKHNQNTNLTLKSNILNEYKSQKLITTLLHPLYVNY